MFVLGIGTGRCGTQTFATYLGLQKINTRHESMILPWEFDLKKADAFLKHLEDGVTIDYPSVGEANFSLLNYVEYFIGKVSSIKIIVLKRVKKDTVYSWMNNQPYVNLWTSEDHDSFRRGDYLKHSEFALAFPKYDLEKASALSQFWDDYYDFSDSLEAKFPQNIKTFDMYELFGDETIQEKLLDFIDISQDKRFVRSLTKKIDSKNIIGSEVSISILMDLMNSEEFAPKKVLFDFKKQTNFLPEQSLKFLTLGISFNIPFEKMSELIFEYENVCKEFFGELNFLDDLESFRKDFKLLLSFLNEKEERYSYPSILSLKVRDLTIKNL